MSAAADHCESCQQHLALNAQCTGFVQALRLDQKSICSYVITNLGVSLGCESLGKFPLSATRHAQRRPSDEGIVRRPMLLTTGACSESAMVGLLPAQIAVSAQNRVKKPITTRRRQ